MEDVARRAGVSLKTVSRVVNGEGVVRPDTAARVQAAISELDFRRNGLARALRGGARTASLGLVIGDVSNPFYSQIARGAEEVVRERGHLVISGSSDEDPERERELILSLCERRVEGLLVVPAGIDHSYLLPELRAGTAVVFLDRLPEDILGVDAVVIDNVGGARRGVEHLIAHGHRRIACLADSSEIYTARERQRGYAEALAGHGLAVDGALVRLGSHDAVGAERMMTELLALDDPPTGVFAGNNRLAVGALRAIDRRGGGTALVGFDDFELADMLATPVTVVAHNPFEMGRRAARMLLERMAGEDGPPRRVELPAELVVRGTGELAPN